MDNYDRIMEILKKCYEPVSAKQLAKQLAVSDRSIRNYIKVLRNRGDKICADERGYFLENTEQFKESGPAKETFCFASPEDRINYIIETIILADKGIDLYDLADSIFISYSTIEKDIMKVKDKLALFDLSLQRKSGHVEISGTESDRRKLISHFLSSNSTSAMNLTLESLCGILKIPLAVVENIVKVSLKEEGLYASDYAVKSILIHVIINIARIKISCFTLSKPLYNISGYHTAEYDCAQNILEKISEKCPIDINEFEIQQLAFIIASKTSNVRIDKKIDIEKIVDNKTLQFVRDVIWRISCLYNIDLNDLDFINFFSLHLSNALFRCEHHVSVTTPLADEIFIQNPLIYDVAVYIAQRVRENFGYELNRDEITFVSLHVGAVLEKIIDEKGTLKACLIVNNYYNYYNDHSIENLNKKLNGKCSILEVTNSIDNVDPSYYDLVIDATGACLHTDAVRVVHTRTILKDKDFEMIQNVCDQMLNKNEMQLFREKLLGFIDARLFEKNHYEDSVEEMIRYMADRMISLGFAPEEFVTSVLDREAVTPTGFDNNVAIPHSIVCSTNRNICFIILNEKPMRWGFFDVQLIMLIGVNYNQRKDFKFVYSKLLESFDDSEVVKSLIKSKDHQEFIEKLVKYV